MTADVPREYASVNVAIWSDPEWRRLPVPAQHLYLLLWTSPGLTYCGTHDWRPKKLRALMGNVPVDAIEAAADCLAARHFLVVDEDTDEVLVRSWARFDGLVKKPRMAVSYVTAYANVASATIRKVLVHETAKMRELWPDLTCWSDRRVLEVLSHESASAKDLPTANDPFEAGLLSVCGEFAANASEGLPPVCTPPTPAPTPAPNTLAPSASLDEQSGAPKNASRKRPATRLPEDWEPNDKHRAVADEQHIDLDSETKRFRLHAQANDRRQADWNASFRLWLERAKPGTIAHSPRPLPNVRDLEDPPPNLTDDQIRDWYDQRRRA